MELLRACRFEGRWLSLYSIMYHLIVFNGTLFFCLLQMERDGKKHLPYLSFSKVFSNFIVRFYCWVPLFEGLFQFLCFKYSYCGDFALWFSHSDRIIPSYLSRTFNIYDARQFSGTVQVDPKLCSNRCLRIMSCLPLPAQ